MSDFDFDFEECYTSDFQSQLLHERQLTGMGTAPFLSREFTTENINEFLQVY